MTGLLPLLESAWQASCRRCSLQARLCGGRGVLGADCLGFLWRDLTREHASRVIGVAPHLEGPSPEQSMPLASLQEGDGQSSPHRALRATHSQPGVWISCVRSTQSSEHLSHAERSAGAWGGCSEQGGQLPALLMLSVTKATCHLTLNSAYD